MRKWHNTVELDGEWRLYSEDNSVFRALSQNPATEQELQGLGFCCIPASVPGNFELDMERAGLLPDLMKGLHMMKVMELENKHLWYVTRFQNPYRDTEHCALRFEGIDTFSEIYLNGALVGETDNMLIPHEIETPDILVGENELVVHIRPSEIEARNFNVEASTSVVAKYSPGSMFVRKAPHMYGWDIMPRAISGGLWRPVSLILKTEEYIHDFYVYTATLRPGRAVIFINYQLCVTGDRIREYRLEIKGGCGDSKVNESYDLWHTSGRIHFYIDQPKLWWTKDMGEPNLYDLEIKLYHEEEMIDCIERRLGVREVKLIRNSVVDKDGNGTFQFVLNGEKLFVRGTNWVPLDAFHSRDAQRLPKALALLDEIGCNMVRCWGGNVYESQEFFDFCDEHGIAVWQDFAMACAIYPMEDEFLKAMKREAESVVKEYRQHTSLFIWSGDNECDASYLWSAVPRDPKQNLITRRLLPEVIQRLDPVRALTFLPSSPYIDENAFETKAALPEDHYWFRTYYKEPCYQEGSAKFISEIGYFGVPAPDSLRKFFTKKGLWPWQNNPEWWFYGMGVEPTADAPNAFIPQTIHDMVEYLFDQAPDELCDYTVASQIVQAEALKFFIEHMRINKWEKTGILCWNLLDGWPQTSNGFVDYYFRKKMAFKTVKTAQLAVLIACGEPENGLLPVYGINEYLQNKTVEYRVTDMDNETVVAEGKTVIRANVSQKLAEFSYDGSQRCYWIDWMADGKEYRSHYLAGKPTFSFEKVTRYYRDLGYYDSTDYQ